MSAWTIEFEESAEEELRNLSGMINDRIVEKLHWLEENFDSITPLPLHAQWSGFYKLRIGDWRVIYDISWDDCLLTIVLIGHRTKIYKRR
ncbi:MAG: type II toxin-antitoxin system mRNA interferase toxin, RelE/StbE family [Candidatus Vogelbacteria bacterium CG10_big_fil_rev_8_21_14_0_10_51_16]|uniref:Type II toxin-antitoxin system mRNA interferase toxin, RelE/StbE family n=1 Tax=Candidatus Vogelbacteria bacterium CG10_big_fil_rev_8_21_14_0_10_51_16 TaxID=1975045 RepID=A0A2H0RE65_9BACT|nr:MAG: type II toxin-antitoxin system mRNA interferase toxin, RelE/StbE family [Candidatus Vogelbacteria bacterium CG10_big_fil_rev_8_21_14_0_10_51_16]